MTLLANLITPPPVQFNNNTQHYQFLNSVHDSLQALTSIPNPSILTNANFATVGTHGTTPITQGDGDTDISSTWAVVGSASATYTITTTPFPGNSTIQSASPYYIHVVINTYSGSGLYFAQTQNNTVRQYQNNKFTFGLGIKNNQSAVIKIRMSIFSYYDTDSKLIEGGTLYLQPGLNQLTTTIQTESLNGKTIGASPYTQFRLNFLELNNGTADLEFYQIKGEFGSISTPLRG